MASGTVTGNCVILASTSLSLGPFYLCLKEAVRGAAALKTFQFNSTFNQLKTLLAGETTLPTRKRNREANNIIQNLKERVDKAVCARIGIKYHRTAIGAALRNMEAVEVLEHHLFEPWAKKKKYDTIIP